MLAGLFVSEGGGGSGSGVTVRVGSGSAGAFRLLLLFVLAFSLVFATGVISSIGEGPTAAFVFMLVFTFEGGITPPAGIPSSPLPVGGCAGFTGWLLGSATNVGVWFVLPLAAVPLFRVNAHTTANKTTIPSAAGIRILMGLIPGFTLGGGWGCTIGTVTGARRAGRTGSTRGRTTVNSSSESLGATGAVAGAG